MTGDRLELRDHERPPRPGEISIGRTAPQQEISATLVLRRASGSADEGEKAQQAYLDAVADFVRSHGLRVEASHRSARSLTVSAPAEDFERAFHVELEDVEHNGRRYRNYAKLPSLPPEVRDIVVGIFGLRARPLRQRARLHHPGSTEPFWTVQDLAQAYDFPAAFDGRGQVIALLEFGGGYDPADLEAFCNARAIPVPNIVFKSIAGAANQPCDTDDVHMFLDVIEGRRDEASCDPALLEAAQATIEVTLDIELAAALAPGAQLVVYMAPATEDGIFQALSAAVHGENPRVDVVTMSWGEAEPSVSAAQFNAVTQLLEDAAERGISICASSGDFGAYDDPESKQLCVNFPASSPLVLACGGTTVMRFESSIEKEVAWNCGAHGLPAATGGGVSDHFPLPEWQKAHTPPASPTGFVGRGLPDVSAAADPHNGCEILVKGVRCSAFGTSAVAPFWAALIARCNQALGTRLGHINPLLYQSAAGATNPFRAIEEGDNNFYRAAAGWNACTGLGTPQGSVLLESLRSLVAKH